MKDLDKSYFKVFLPSLTITNLVKKGTKAPKIPNTKVNINIWRFENWLLSNMSCLIIAIVGILYTFPSTTWIPQETFSSFSSLYAWQKVALMSEYSVGSMVK